MLKDEILNCVQKRDWVSFAELERLDGFKDVSGAKETLAIHHPHFNNVLIWTGVTLEAIVALTELVNEGKIHWMPGEWLSYAADGRMLNLPIVKRAKHYSKPHWLPVFYRPGPLPAKWRKGK